MSTSTPLFLARNSVLSHGAYQGFAELVAEISDKVVATYIWVDPIFNDNMHGRSKVLDFVPADISQVPSWECCTHENPHEEHANFIEQSLKPVKIYRDPFLRGKNIIVLCECYYMDGKPALTNHRHACVEAMTKVEQSTKLWFGIEQEYVLVDVDKDPVAWPKRGYPRQGLAVSHCAVGTNRVCGRYVSDSHLRACLYAGIKIAGTNAEAVPSQWEYQIGTSAGVDVADDLWASRYILERIGEEFGVGITFDPRPVPGGGYIGTGAHCNFSTEEMRTPGNGLKAMEEACLKLEKRHSEHLAKYDLRGGNDNKRRLDDVSRSKFTWGVGTRGTSVRIPGLCHSKGYGYIEDRRPGASADPYTVIDMLVRTVCLDE